MTDELAQLLATELEERAFRRNCPSAADLIGALVKFAGSDIEPEISLEAMAEAMKLMGEELQGFTGEQIRTIPPSKWPIRARSAIEAWSIAQSQVRHDEFVRRQQ